MRAAAIALLVLTALSSCSGDDADRGAPATDPTTTTAAPSCRPEPTLPPAADGSPAEVVATVGDVKIAVVDHGASVDVVSLFVAVDCELRAVTLLGERAALPIGGTVTHGDGLACSADAFEVHTATSDDGVTYQTTTTRYRLDGTALVEMDRVAAALEAKDDPGALDAYYRLDC